MQGERNFYLLLAGVQNGTVSLENLLVYIYTCIYITPMCVCVYIYTHTRMYVYTHLPYALMI